MLLANLGGLRDHAGSLIGDDMSLAVVLHITKAPMRIAQVAPLFEAVPPQLYGGTERVVSHLTEELVRRGHDVTLFASGDSRTAATSSRWSLARCVWARQTATLMLVDLIRELDLAFARAGDFDVIHCHVDYLAFPFGGLVGRRPSTRCTGARTSSSSRRSTATSPDMRSSRSAMPSASPCAISTWPGRHGVPRPAPRGLPVCVPGPWLPGLPGSHRPEKKPDVAIEIARRAGVPLKIAAKVDAVDREYFERVVAPLLDDPLRGVHRRDRRRRQGGVPGRRAGAALSIDWPEPFGLVMIEAMACGTPVIAYPAARCPRSSSTGARASSDATLVEMVGRGQAAGRDRARRVPPHVERHFTVAQHGRRLREGLPEAGRPAPRGMSEPEIVGEQYYILASEVAALPKLVLKHDDAFLVADRRGDLPNLPQSEFGFYVDGTRFLHRLQTAAARLRADRAQRRHVGGRRASRHRPHQPRRPARTRPGSCCPVARCGWPGGSPCHGAQLYQLLVIEAFTPEPARADAGLEVRRRLRRRVRGARPSTGATRCGIAGPGRRRGDRARLSRARPRGAHDHAELLARARPARRERRRVPADPQAGNGDRDHRGGVGGLPAGAAGPRRWVTARRCDAAGPSPSRSTPSSSNSASATCTPGWPPSPGWTD